MKRAETGTDHLLLLDRPLGVPYATQLVSENRGFDRVLGLTAQGFAVPYPRSNLSPRSSAWNQSRGPAILL